jgi:hypothetical protein
VTTKEIEEAVIALVDLSWPADRIKFACLIGSALSVALGTQDGPTDAERARLAFQLAERIHARAAAWQDEASKAAP